MMKKKHFSIGTTSYAAAIMIMAIFASDARSDGSTEALPESFQVKNRTVAVTLHGVGAQIYQCMPLASGGNAWSFREPAASLLDNGKTVGRHYAGPTWELADGSIVKGRSVATSPGTTTSDVPLLKLDVIEHHGDGRLGSVTTILRLNTRGGMLAGACGEVGALQAQPYSADYLFLR